MKNLIQTLNKFLAPVLIMGYLTLCIVLLAAVPGGKVGILLAILWSILSALALRWGVWGILCLAKKRATKREQTVLTRTAEGLMLLLSAATAVLCVLLWDIPPIWAFLPVPWFGLEGAVRFDAQFLTR